MVLHPFRGATDDGQLAVLESVHASGIQAPSVSYADCQDFQDSLRSISGLLLNQKGPASVGDGESAYSAWFEVVSGNYFDVLGVKPSLGRTFTRDEYGDRARALRRSSATGCGRSISGATRPFSAAPYALTGTRSPSSAWRLRNFTAIFRESRWMAGFQRHWPASTSAMRGNVLTTFSLAGFQVTTIGRFWVTAEGAGGHHNGLTAVVYCA